jgi:tetratricopeptide (TPR) repeat protein
VAKKTLKSAKKNKPSRGSVASSPVLSAPQQQLFNQGVAAHRAGQLGAAAQAYQALLQQCPNHADSLHLLGLVCQASGDNHTAITLVRQAIAVNGNVAAYHFNLGVLLQAVEENATAIEAYRKAIRLNSDYLQAYENLAVAQQDAGEYRAAQQTCELALKLNPNSLIALRNLATLMFRNGDSHVALALFDRALAISPADPELHEKRAACYLRLGQYAQGWAEYRWRFSNHQTWLDASTLRSTGLRHAVREDLSGRRILLSSEQGLGDQLMFASCYDDILKDTHNLVIEQSPRLVPLVQRSFPRARVVAVGEYDPRELDCQLRAGDLPGWYRNCAEDFSGQAYLRACEEKTAAWKARLDGLPGLKIGISWRGGREARAAVARSIPLKNWQTLFKASDASFIALQYDMDEAESALVENTPALHRFDELDLRNDIDALAALISALDLVISVDNTTIHLAGALGQTTWALLPRGPDGRWQDGCDNSVWYKSLRLFRNPSAEHSGWQGVFRQVSAELEAFRPVVADALPAVEGPGVVSGSVSSPAGERVLLLNDTSDWYHWGCSATSLAIHHQLRQRFSRVDSLPIALGNKLNGLPQQAAQFDDDAVYLTFTQSNPELHAMMANTDVVVINGEGSLHGFNLTSAGLLYLAYIAATRYRKPVHIINHSCYPADNDLSATGEVVDFYRRIYQEMTTVAIREPVSYRLMEKMGIGVEQSFDCLPLFVEQCCETGAIDDTWMTWQSAGPVVLAGCVNWQGSGGRLGIPLLAELARQLHQQGRRVQVLVGTSASMALDDIDFVRQFKAAAGEAFELVFAATELDWLRCIASASALVSGRFHHSIAAAFLGTPLLVAHSNTPKISGLLELLDMEDALLDLGEAALPPLLEKLDRRLQDGSAYLLAATRRAELIDKGMKNFGF